MSSVPGRPPREEARRPWREAEFVALDFETTGLDPRTDAVVAFGAVPIRAGRVVLGESVYRLVTPEAPLTATSIVIHGLRPVDLEQAPSLADVSADLADALRGRYLLAWAAHIEAAFLSTTFGGRPTAWRRRVVDVVDLVRVVDAGEPGAVRSIGSLTEVAGRFGVPVEQPHHALDDAITTAQLFLALMPRLAERGVDTPRRLLRAGRRRGWR